MQGIFGIAIRLGISVALLSLAAIFGQWHGLSPQAAGPEQAAGFFPAPGLATDGLAVGEQPSGFAVIAPGPSRNLAGPALTPANDPTLSNHAGAHFRLCRSAPGAQALAGVSTWTTGPAGTFEPAGWQ